MIRTVIKVPRNVAVAVSGGPDSMAVLDFLRRGQKNILALHFNHGTPHADAAQTLVTCYCKKYDIPLTISSIGEPPPAGESRENYWRSCRYKFFDIATQLPIITCHHLDDSVENWIFTSLHGNPMMIPLQRDKFIRPFLAAPKVALLEWCERKDVPYVNDPSNDDISFMRNYIRHELIPRVLIVNPGLHKVIKKKIFEMQKTLITHRV
jgi:tRNA(Ile)-lysidine synthase